MPAETRQATVYEPEALLTPAELAQRLKVSVSWIFEQTRRRASVRSEEAIPVVPVGRYLRFYWPDVCEWLKRKAEARAKKLPSGERTNRLTKSLDTTETFR